MSKVTWTFELPEEQEEKELMEKGPKLDVSARDFANWLRNENKHGDHDEKTQGVIEWCRDNFYRHFEGLLD